MRLPGDGVHGQLLPEGFLFPPVCEPVIDSHLCHQVGAEALSFGGGDASLQTLSPDGRRLGKWKKLALTFTWQRFLARLQEGVAVPVALLYQRLPLLLAGVLLPFVRLVQDVLGRRPPFETITSHFLARGFGAHVLTRLTLTGRVELWEKKHRILIAFVCHIAARTMCCLVELCKNKKRRIQ